MPRRAKWIEEARVAAEREKRHAGLLQMEDPLEVPEPVAMDVIPESPVAGPIESATERPGMSDPPPVDPGELF